MFKGNEYLLWISPNSRELKTNVSTKLLQDLTKIHMEQPKHKAKVVTVLKAWKKTNAVLLLQALSIVSLLLIIFKETLEGFESEVLSMPVNHSVFWQKSQHLWVHSSSIQVRHSNCLLSHTSTSSVFGIINKEVHSSKGKDNSFCRQKKYYIWCFVVRTWWITYCKSPVFKHARLVPYWTIDMKQRNRKHVLKSGFSTRGVSGGGGWSTRWVEEVGMIGVAVKIALPTSWICCADSGETYIFHLLRSL